MAIDVRSKTAQKLQRTGQVGGALPSTLEQLGKKLWGALKGIAAELGFGVPGGARKSVGADLAVLLGVKTAPTMGRRDAFHLSLDQAKAVVVEEVERKLAHGPVSGFNNRELVRAEQASALVVKQLGTDRLQRDLFDLPRGSVLHEDGHLPTALDNAPAHVEVRSVPNRRTIDEIGQFLGVEARRDGKTHAWEVNGALIEVRPGADGKVDVGAAIKQWEARRTPNADQRSAQAVLGKLTAEVSVREQREANKTHAVREAEMRAQLTALPPGTAVFAFQPDGLRELGVKVNDAPFLLHVEEAAAWVAKEAERSKRPAAYKFNDVLLVADPSKARGAVLEQLVLHAWEQRA